MSWASSAARTSTSARARPRPRGPARRGPPRRRRARPTRGAATRRGRPARAWRRRGRPRRTVAWRARARSRSAARSRATRSAWAARSSDSARPDSARARSSPVRSVSRASVSRARARGGELGQPVPAGAALDDRGLALGGLHLGGARAARRARRARRCRPPASRDAASSELLQPRGLGVRGPGRRAEVAQLLGDGGERGVGLVEPVEGALVRGRAPRPGPPSAPASSNRTRSAVRGRLRRAGARLVERRLQVQRARRGRRAARGAVPGQHVAGARGDDEVRAGRRRSRAPPRGRRPRRRRRAGSRRPRARARGRGPGRPRAPAPAGTSPTGAEAGRPCR